MGNKRSFGMMLAGLLCLGSAGCITENVPPPPPRVNLVQSLGLPQAQQLLQETLRRSINPQVADVKATDEVLEYSYREVIVVATGRILNNQIAFINAAEVVVHGNNLVQIFAPSKVVLAQFVFSNNTDATTFAELIRSFHHSRKNRAI